MLQSEAKLTANERSEGRATLLAFLKVNVGSGFFLNWPKAQLRESLPLLALARRYSKYCNYICLFKNLESIYYYQNGNSVPYSHSLKRVLTETPRV